MNRMLAGIVLLVMTCVACSDDDSDKEATFRSIQAQCADVMTPLCTRYVECGATGTVSQCVNEGVPACCASYCNSAAITPESDIQRCKDAVEAASCTDLNANLLPALCKGVVKRPASLAIPIDLTQIGSVIAE